MRHLYECPMRWADLDLQGHVNNVTYVDYLQEARVDMLRIHAPDTRTDDLAEGVVVVRHEVGYRSPLTFDPGQTGPRVSIETWVSEIRAASFTVAYEVFTPSDEAGGDGRRVHLRASTVLTPYVFATERPRRLTRAEKDALEPFLEAAEPVRGSPLGPVPETAVAYPVRVRFSDVDAYGHVNNVCYFTYFQEARIALMARLGRDLAEAEGLRTVVAQTDVDYKVPILFRPEAYEAHAWISAVGTTSFTIDSVIRDGERLLARARVACVWFDPASGRPAPPPEEVRERQRRAMAAPQA